MKTIKSFLAFLATAALLAACAPNEPEKVDPSLDIKPSSLSFTAEGGTETVTLTVSEAKWTAQSSESWASVSPSGGDPGNIEVKVTAAANSGEARSATITFSAGSVQKTLSVSQQAYVDPFVETPYAEPVFDKNIPVKDADGDWPRLTEDNMGEFIGGESRLGFEFAGVAIENSAQLDPPSTGNALGFDEDDSYLIISGIELDQLVTKAGEAFGIEFSASFLKSVDPAGAQNGFAESDLQIFVGEDNEAPEPAEGAEFDPVDKWSPVPVSFKDGAPAGKWSGGVCEFAVKPEKVATKGVSTRIKLLIRGIKGLHVKDIIVKPSRRPTNTITLASGASIGFGGRPALFPIRTVTVKQFLASPTSSYRRYRLKGTVSDIRNATYGNFTLTDDSGSVLVYGLTAKSKRYGGANDKSFGSLGIKLGDIVTLVGFRGAYNGTPEVVYAYHESHETPKLPEYSVSEVMDINFKEKMPFQLKESLVLAVNKRGFVLADPEATGWKAHIYAYKGSDHSVKRGDKVTLIGDRTTYNGVPEIENLSDIKVISSGNPAPWPQEEIDSDGGIDQIVSLGHAAFCCIVGRLEKSGNYYNVTIVNSADLLPMGQSRKVSIQYPDDANMDVEEGGIDNMSGRFVKIYGFFNGISKSGSQEYFNIIPVMVYDLYLYDHPSGYTRTNDNNMLVKDAVVAANIQSPGHTSVMILTDAGKEGYYVPLFYVDEAELVQAKPGDKFDLLYCFVQHGTNDQATGAWSPRQLRYKGYYEGYATGGSLELKNMEGPFTLGSELVPRSSGVTYMEVTGRTSPGSALMVLSDGFFLAGVGGAENSIIYSEKKSLVTARGFYLYGRPTSGTFLFTSIEKSEEDVSQSIPDILVSQIGAKVMTPQVVVSAVSSDGFVVSQGNHGIYVDLSQMSSSARSSLMPQVGDLVQVGGVRSTVASVNAPCIGGTEVTVEKSGKTPQLIPAAESVDKLVTYSSARHIKLVGEVDYDSKTKFLRLKCFGSETSVLQFYNPASDLQSLLLANKGKYVSVEAFYLGRTGDGIANHPYLFHVVADKVEQVTDNFNSTLIMTPGAGNGRFEEKTCTVNGVPGVTVYALHNYAYGILSVPAGVKSISFYAVSAYSGGLSVMVVQTPENISIDPSVLPSESSLTVQEANRYTIEIPDNGLGRETVLNFSWMSNSSSISGTPVYVFGIRANGE